VRWTQASRKHRIGRAHARHVMATAELTAATTSNSQRGVALGRPDDRGIELEVIAFVLPDRYMVIHVMPTRLRSGPA